MERPLDSIARIEAVASVPVVAALPSAEPELEQAKPSRHRPTLRTALLLGGALIVAASGTAVVGALL